MTEEQSTSDDEYALRVAVRPFSHYFATKYSRSVEFPEKIPEELIVRHVGTRGDQDIEVDETTECDFTYLPIQPSHQLCDDPTNNYFYTNEQMQAYPQDKYFQLPNPGLIIRPHTPKLVQGLTPAGHHVAMRVQEQVESYCKYEHQLGVICLLEAQMLYNALQRAEATMGVIGNCRQRLENNDLRCA